MIFLNASDHKYNFAKTEISFLSFFADRNSFNLSVSLGGAESMRDLKYAQDMGIFCYELFFIESSFAFTKFIDSLQCLDSSSKSPNLQVFINASTPSSLELLYLLPDLIGDSPLPLSLSVIFDRRYLAHTLFSIPFDELNLSACEQTLHEALNPFIGFLDTKNICYGFSGGVNIKSLSFLLKNYPKLSHINTGLFTFMPFATPQNPSHVLTSCHHLELKLLYQLRRLQSLKSSYIEERADHLSSYIIQSTLHE